MLKIICKIFKNSALLYLIFWPAYLSAYLSLIFPINIYAQEAANGPAKKDLSKLRQIWQSEPRRIEDQLREENVTDQEVLEIQKASLAVMPGAIVNIGGVTTNCPCGYGTTCAAQVWIVTNRPNESVGFMLTKINGHWVLGPIQQWWFRYRQHQDKKSTLPRSTYNAEDKAKWDEWEIEEQELINEFPGEKCEGKDNLWKW